MTEPTRDDRGAWWLLGFGLLASTWLAYYPLPFFEFYKEWVFAVALGIAMLVLRPQPAGLLPFRHPLAYGAFAILATLLLQAVLRDGLWPRAALMACYVGFFLFALAAGQRMYAARREQSLLWVAGFLLVAALGNCFFAGLQLNHVEFSMPLVAPRSGDRITANLAQANHFADLLWLGCFAAAYLHVRGRIGFVPLLLVSVTLLFFSHLTGSRMVLVYAGLAIAFGTALLVWSSDRQVRRLSAVLALLGGLTVMLAIVLSNSGVQELFGTTSGADRITSDTGAGSSRLRMWLWRAGLDAAQHAPLLGVGAGRFVGHAHGMSMADPGSPPAGADANAHNLFIHLAAELGIPVTLVLGACFAFWLVVAVRRCVKHVDSLAALVLCGVILVHANLEYPLWYTYFLGMLGLLAGHLSLTDTVPSRVSESRGAGGLRFTMPLALLILAGVAYAQFAHLEAAMQRVVMQVGLGAAPQRDSALEAELAKLPKWSPYRDHAESILLMTALPTKDSAAEIATRCDRAVAWAPNPYLLARCATAHQVSGDGERASYFANSLCKMFPASDLVLIQSMHHVGRTSVEAEDLVSSCVERMH